MSKRIYMAPVAINTGTKLRTGLLAGSDGEILDARPTHTVTNPTERPGGTGAVGVDGGPQDNLDHLKDW